MEQDKQECLNSADPRRNAAKLLHKDVRTEPLGTTSLPRLLAAGIIKASDSNGALGSMFMMLMMMMTTKTVKGINIDRRHNNCRSTNVKISKV